MEDVYMKIMQYLNIYMQIGYSKNIPKYLIPEDDNICEICFERIEFIWDSDSSSNVLYYIYRFIKI